LDGNDICTLRLQAIDKAKQSGMVIAAVRNSARFGAIGYYT
jgi:LDH2 family malate/lactate/ureidoglycolate dehydrogenase